MWHACLISNAWSMLWQCLICVYSIFLFVDFTNTTACAEWQTCNWAFSGTVMLFDDMVVLSTKLKIFLRNVEAPLHWTLLIYFSINLLRTSSYSIILTNTIGFVCAVHPCNWYLEYRVHICWSSHWNSIISWEECCAPTRFNNRPPWNTINGILIPGMPTHVCMTFTIFCFSHLLYTFLLEHIYLFKTKWHKYMWPQTDG